MSGSRTLSSRLHDVIAARGHWSAAELSAMRREDCSAIFDQPPSGELGELMALFATAWRQLGDLVQQSFAGSFAALVEDATHSAERLVRILEGAAFFRDVARLDDLDVPLYKRAQLCASDLAAALAREGLGRFDDLDALTLFADNLVPHVLRLDGVLVVHPELGELIERGELLSPGSPEEVELRAVAVHAVERLAAAVPGATPRALDHLLWHRGQGARYKAVPRPRCRTTAY